MAEARSKYRQVRLTVTEESGNWVTVRILVKPLDAGWTMKDSVYHHRFRTTGPTPHWLDLLAHAYRVLGMEDMGSP